jgi:hypothetical protein
MQSLLGDGRKRWLILGGIVLLAVVLRSWDFTSVAEDTLYSEPDSEDKVSLAQTIAFERESPEYYRHPWLLINTSALLLKAGAALGLEGTSAATEIMIGYMIGLSLGTLALVYFISRVALLAAYVFAVIPIGVVGTHYIKEDTPVMFSSNLALLMMLLLIRTRDPKYYLWGGFLTGVAIASKLSALLLVPLGAVALLLVARESEHWRTALSCWQLPVAVVLVPVGFFAFNHQLLLNLPDFWSHVMRQLEYSQSGHWDGTVFRPWDYLWTFQLRYGLFPGLTAPIALAGVVGAFLCLRYAGVNPAAFLLALWSIGFYLSVERSIAKPYPLFVRYLYPAIPGLVCFAAYALRGLFEIPIVARRGRPIALAVTGVVLVLPLLRTVGILDGMFPDTRETSSVWIEDNIPRGKRILLDGRFYSPRLGGRYRTRVRALCREDSHVRRARADYIVTNSFNYERFFLNEAFTAASKRSADCYRWLFESCEILERFRPPRAGQTFAFHNPEIRIYDMNRCERSRGP